MNSYNLLNDPNFVSALHRLRFKVIVDRLAQWENISITDLYANPDMNTEMERLFGVPVYEEHKEMLRKAATQSRFYCSTMEEVITTMKKEEKAEEARNNNITNLKPFNSLSQKSTNESVFCGPSTSSIKVMNSKQAASKKVFPHQPITNPSLLLSSYNRDIATPQTVEAPAYINQSYESAHNEPLYFSGNLNYLSKPPTQRIGSRIEPIHQTSYHSKLHRTSSMLVNNEQASASFYPMASMDRSPAPALYSGVVKKKPPVSTLLNEQLRCMGLSSVESKFTRENTVAVNNSNSDIYFKGTDLYTTNYNLE